MDDAELFQRLALALAVGLLVGAGALLLSVKPALHRWLRRVEYAGLSAAVWLVMGDAADGNPGFGDLAPDASMPA